MEHCMPSGQPGAHPREAIAAPTGIMKIVKVCLVLKLICLRVKLHVIVSAPIPNLARPEYCSDGRA